MTKSKKMLATIIVLVIMFVSVTGALVVVLVANTQSAKSNVHVKYTSTDVNVRVEAKYYVGTTGTDLMNGASTYIDLSPTSETGSLNQVANEVLLDKDNDKIIYEYKFTNLSDKIPAIIRQTVNADNTLMVPTDTYNNVGLTYTSSSTSLGSGATSNKTTLNAQGLPINTTRYVYVIVGITDLLKNVAFNGDFGWTLEKGEAITTNASSGSQSIVVDTTDEKLYNKSAMKNLQLVVGVENTEPEYPMIEEKHFSGWYSDSGYNNLVEFPMIPTVDTKLYPKHDTATSDLEYTYSYSAYAVKAGTYSNAGYTGTATNIIIADIHNDGTNNAHSVTSIGGHAFESISTITSVVIPDSVTRIEYDAFNSCSGLTSITIPDSVTSIGSYAFDGCSGLTSITIPNSVTSIGSSAFSGCSGLTSIIVSSGNTKYRSEGNCLIENSSKTLLLGCKNSVIPNSITSIGSSAFYRCSGLTSITIPDSVTSIGSSAFSQCRGLTSITIPNSVTSIGSSAFSSCSGLTSITIPDSVTSIGTHAFINCVGLTNITIPNSVTSIGSFAFCNCYRLTSITIPNSVTSIESFAFSDCSGLTSITIPDSVTSIGSYAFQSCSGLTSITIPDSVTSIGDSAFDRCSGLTSVTIGSGVKRIDMNAFSNCTKLTSVKFANPTGWTVTTSSTATTGDAVTISATDFAANATLLKTTHSSKYWNRA